MHGYFHALRIAGAQARRVLLDAAAAKWNVPVGELSTEPSVVVHKASGRRINGTASRQRHAQRRRQPRLDAHHLDLALIPGGDAGDEAAAADGDQQRIEIGDLAFELEADGALALHGLHLVERV